jgi:hypothetical protein
LSLGDLNRVVKLFPREKEKRSSLFACSDEEETLPQHFISEGYATFFQTTFGLSDNLFLRNLTTYTSGQFHKTFLV